MIDHATQKPRDTFLKCHGYLPWDSRALLFEIWSSQKYDISLIPFGSMAKIKGGGTQTIDYVLDYYCACSLLRATELKYYRHLTFLVIVYNFSRLNSSIMDFLAARLKLISHFFIFDRHVIAKETIIFWYFLLWWNVDAQKSLYTHLCILDIQDWWGFHFLNGLINTSLLHLQNVLIFIIFHKIKQIKMGGESVCPLKLASANRTYHCVSSSFICTKVDINIIEGLERWFSS